MNKTVMDFLQYQQKNVVWFAFNFLLITLPIICLGGLNSISENLDIAGAGNSYLWLMIVVLIVNLAQTILRPRMFNHVKKTASLSIGSEQPAAEVADSDQG